MSQELVGLMLNRIVVALLVVRCSASTGAIDQEEKIMKTSVAVIGGGCAGWFAADELTRRGICCVVLDTDPPAAFASTRNQGWLQSGAFYAAMEDDIPTARFCYKGFHLIRSRYPNAIRTGISSYFLLPHEEELHMVVKNCRNHAIPVRPVSIEDVKRREPILGSSRLACAVEVPDIPFDSSRLLQEITAQTCARGALFRAVSSMEAVMPLWDGENWHIFLDSGDEIECRAIILACGAYIPDMLERTIPGQTCAFKRTKNLVLVLQGEIAKSILIPLGELQGPHLVPFNGIKGNGASVCLYHIEEDIADYRDYSLPLHYQERFAESLMNFYPGLLTMLSQGVSVQAHFYVCQKLYLTDDFKKNPSGRRPVCLSYSPQAGGLQTLFAFYPGKFTSAPVAAQECIDELERCTENLRTLSATAEGDKMSVPAIARQRYYDTPRYTLAVKNGELVFDPYRVEDSHKIFVGASSAKE
ncbi:MAG TPA: FAD-dependent oxidoreductase [Ktedonobacteraceae bacterium]|nr:FAD-dependent oxidoreductase [Ktedonobacteraceae bacterium]